MTRECFVIAPIGPEGSEIRRRSDQILNHVIRPVVEAHGFTAVRGDEIDKAGLITTQVLDRIINNDLVIADLTDQNPNVFYELAVRHALRRPFVQLMAHDQHLPFDVQGMRTILIDHTDLDSVENAKTQLGSQIRGIDRESDIVTPMSVALSLQELRGSSSAEETGLSQIMQVLPQMMDILQELRRDVSAGPWTGAGPPRHDDGERQVRRLVETLTDRGVVDERDLAGLLAGETSSRFKRWVEDLIRRARRGRP